jgi:hypothetical protein
MNPTIWLSARTLNCVNAGGHFWAYLNWALGLRSLGCQVVWLETVPAHTSAEDVRSKVRALKDRLKPYGLADHVSIYSNGGGALSPEIMAGCRNLEESTGAELLLDMSYGLPLEVLQRFRRTALLDIDPGLLQIWMSRGLLATHGYDYNFTIGETVGRPEARFPDCGLEWEFTPPCISLDWWPTHEASLDAPFNTISNWYMDEWVEDGDGFYMNDKRTGFLPFLGLAKTVSQPLELLLCLAADDDEERKMLRDHGWRVRDAWKLTSTPQDYQRIIQAARGEFSCAKPSCVRLQNAWISDRTLCYLASGKPAVVQHTGVSRFLPDASGLFRFRDLEEAARFIERAAVDYGQQCKLARALAEEYFDAKKVVRSVLDKALN